MQTKWLFLCFAKVDVWQNDYENILTKKFTHEPVFKNKISMFFIASKYRFLFISLQTLFNA